MPHASRTRRSGAPDASADLAAVADFLRGLAQRTEQDPAFGQQIASALAEAGLVPGGRPAKSSPRSARPRGATPRAGTPVPTDTADLDPYTLLREVGEEALRIRLDALTTPELHAVIRAHRLDPARISARWSTQPRLIELIVAQVRARADHGKAFSRV
jgi:hypothetical protein